MKEDAMFILVIGILIVLFSGDPDLIDALIHNLMK